MTSMNSHKWSVLTGVAAGTFLATLDAAVVNIAMPAMLETFRTTLEVLEWVLLAYLLTITGLLITFGRIADIFGHKRIYLAGLALFSIGSAACALAPDIGLLIAARVFQALGATAIIAIGPALLMSAFPPHQRGWVLGLLSTTVAAGLTFGPPLGGFVLRHYEWPTVFWINVPLGLIALFWARASIAPDIKITRPATFDIQGATLLLATFSGILLTATSGQRYGWGELETVGLAFGTLISLIWLVRAESETPDPIIDLTLLKNSRFAGAAIAGVLAFMMLYGANFLLPFYLTKVKGYATDSIGLFLIIVPLVLLLLSPLTGWLSDRYGTRGLCVLGLTIMAAGLLLAGEMNEGTAAWDTALRLGLIGVGIALFLSPNNSAMLGSAPPQRLGTASGLLATTRNAGMVLGIALGTALFNARFVHETGHGIEGYLAGDAAIFSDSLRLALHVAAALAAPAILASLLKSPGQTQEPPTLF